MSQGEEGQEFGAVVPQAPVQPPVPVLPPDSAPPVSPQPVSGQPVSAGPVSALPLPPELTIASGATPAPRVPGAADERFQRFPTGMVGVPVGAGVTTSGTTVDGDEPHVAEWSASPVPTASTHRGVAGWGLGFSIAGLAVSFFVGWGFPIALVGLVTGAFALRRPTESRAIAGWALALGIAGLVYSAGWLVFAATSSNLFG